MNVKKRIKPLFIFSLPRSGSTLLQRALTSSEAIVSLSEPWILLPFLYALREDGIYTEYSHQTCLMALEDFFTHLPNGKEDYLQGLHQFAMSLYQKAGGDKALYFLDKSPRYHTVSNEVISLFPEGKFLFLWRNPLAIVSSIIEAWGKGHWNVYQFNIDLYRGLPTLIRSYEMHKHECKAIRYEDLVSDPDRTLKDIFSYLDVAWDPEVVQNFAQKFTLGRMGDPTGVKEYNYFSREPIDKWKTTMRNKVRKRWCKDYLDFIGENAIELMGYSQKSLMSELDNIQGTRKRYLLDFMFVQYGKIYPYLEKKIIMSKLNALRTKTRSYHHW